MTTVVAVLSRKLCSIEACDPNPCKFDAFFHPDGFVEGGSCSKNVSSECNEIKLSYEINRY